MKAYKGFNENMTAYGGFQYEEGKTYKTDEAVICHSGFHACEYPLDCFNYYDPGSSVYHEVEVDGDIQHYKDDTKICGKKIHIGAKLSIAGLVKAAIDYTNERTNSEAKADGNYGASSATGYKGASSATGDYGASSATGNCGASSATGYKGASESGNESAVAVAWGYKAKAKGVFGSYLVLADWEGDDKDWNNPKAWTLKGAKMIQIDGKKYKPDTWYTMKNGEVVEAE